MTTQVRLAEVLKAIDRKDPDGFASHLTDDAVFRYGSQEPVKGKEAIRAAVAAFFDTVESLHHRLIDTWHDERSLVMQGEVTYMTKDQREVTVPFVNVFRLEGDLINEYLIYVDSRVGEQR